MPGDSRISEVGVCSWSVRPASPVDLAAAAAECGVVCVQLALDPLRTGAWALDETRDALAAGGTRIVSAMMGMAGEDYSSIPAIRRTGGVRPDETWDANRAASAANADLARELGVDLVTFHAGFIPEDQDDPERETMIERLAELAGVFGDRAVHVALETGQERADTLLGVLADERLTAVGVNFDPANMLLYGSGDPVEALRQLAPRVMQVHLKDADPAPAPDVWGAERPLGEGKVDWPAFFSVVEQRLPGVNLIIEREAGETRVRDIRQAAEMARGYGFGG